MQKEIQIHSILKHPNVVQYCGKFFHNQKLYIVLECCSGGNLFHYIRNHHPMKHDEIRNIFDQVLKAFKYLHSKGVVMRDLKPENIILTNNNKTVKICDFGWSSFIEDKEWLIKMAGTYAYMAPEVLMS